MNPDSARALADLRDIHLPDPVAFWPPAPGWWIVAGALVASGLAVHLYLRARRRSLRRAALRELDVIAEAFHGDRDVSGLALGIATLLRRVALARFPRREVAGLTGADWSHFLLRTSGDCGFTEGMVRDLAISVYAGPRMQQSGASGEAWITATRGWIGGNT